MKIGAIEELILLAVGHNGGESHGAKVRETLQQAGQDLSAGSTYITLDRLETKGLLESREGETLPGGVRIGRRYRLTGEGRSVLDEVESTRMRLRSLHGLAGGAA